MGSGVNTIRKLACCLIIAGFASFFICISLIDASFLLYVWLPFIATHCTMAFIIKYIHNREDKKKQEETGTGKFLSIIFLALSIGVSIVATSFVITLCKDPYCTQVRAPFMDPVTVYTIIAIFEYFNLCTFFDFCFIKFAGTRNLIYRLSISFPAMLHFTTCVLSSVILWLYPITAYFAASDTQYTLILYSPVSIYVFVYLLSINGLYNSLCTNWSYIYINMKAHTMSLNTLSSSIKPLLEEDKQQPSNSETLYKYPIRCASKQYVINKSKSLSYSGNNSIRICQITDPHIGPLMSINRLKRICRDIVQQDPDLVLLTGDYFSGEANLDGLLLKALEPLKSISVKCFACLGNHDMESNEVYNRTLIELRRIGIKLLRNNSVIYDKLAIGPIQIIGFDYIWHHVDDRAQRHRNILAQNPCPTQCRNRRIVLLHDPGGFNDFDENEHIMVFSGHSHGGHCGIVSCGFHWTAFYLLLHKPDNGLWEKGYNKLYVHRGQGSRALYGNYMLRCGVPTEQSVVHIEW